MATHSIWESIERIKARALWSIFSQSICSWGENNYRSKDRGSQINNNSASTLYALRISKLKSRQLNESIEPLRSAITLNPVIQIPICRSVWPTGKEDHSIKQKLLWRAQINKAMPMRLMRISISILQPYNKRESFAEAWRELELYIKEAKGLKDKSQIKRWLPDLKRKINQGGEPSEPQLDFAAPLIGPRKFLDPLP